MPDQDNGSGATAPGNGLKPIVSHTPIIVTDGSASIEFTESVYTRDPESNLNRANVELHLIDVVSRAPHTPGQMDFTCFQFDAGQLYEIEVKCKGGGGYNDFQIRGSLDPAPAPEIQVDRGEYKEDLQHFPPAHTTSGNRFGSMNRAITKLRIFKLVNGQRVQLMHDCPLVATPRNSWTVTNPHMAQDHDDHVGVGKEEEEVVQPV